MKLSGMPYASAHVEKHFDGSLDLISYVTRVVSIDKDGWMECTGTYSTTTRKHIGSFMRNEVSAMCGHPLGYYAAKYCYENNVKMNIYTGEIIPA